MEVSSKHLPSWLYNSHHEGQMPSPGFTIAMGIAYSLHVCMGMYEIVSYIRRTQSDSQNPERK
jgi:hypothetical protein